MACSYARSLVSSASRLLKFSSRALPASRSCLLDNVPHINSSSLWLHRGFTRSHWVLCGENQGNNLRLPVPGGVRIGPSATCNCSRLQLHTEVDKELVEFLDKEIGLEKETAKNKGGLPKLTGFDVKTDGTNLSLTRTVADETITIKFNVNNSVDADAPPEITEAEKDGEMATMVSKPPFVVEINKGGNRTLAMQCSFPLPEEFGREESRGQEDPEETIVDPFEIDEITLHEGEWKEEVYALHSSVMDGNLYDLLMDMLDERGITEEFVNQMVEYSTAFEHGKYVEFLEGLKSFTKDK